MPAFTLKRHSMPTQTSFFTRASLTVAACLCSALALANPTWEVNTASEADLDSLKGVGPALTARVLAERNKARFDSWQDLMNRVKGIKAPAAARLSAQGLTVNGLPFEPPQAAPASAPAR